MPTTFLYINNATLDSFGDVWAVGRDLTNYDGSEWSYFNSQNSVVPSNVPYFLDTRSISIDTDNKKWVGCAVTASLSQDIVFVAEGQQAATGASWNINQFGNLLTTSPNWEVPTIHASPYAQEVLAFISPLNGGAGTGGTANTGVTGGYLWRYDKVSEIWSEVSPGYTWPHIYEISSKGEGGDSFHYYISTDDGLQIIPPGKLDNSTLDDGTIYIPQLRKLNSFTSGIGGNTVYSVSFDENGNYWNVAGDLSFMFPMFEMSGEEHYRFLPNINYIYNESNPINDHKVNMNNVIQTVNKIRNKTPYEKL